MIEEVFGVHEHIKDVCRRFAKQGYLAIAPELYARLGDVVAMTDIHQVIETVNKAPDATAFADLDSTVAWAGKNGGDLKRLGIVGFCRGGRMVWMYASHNPSLKAGVSWYGSLVGDPTPAMPTQPLDLVDKIKVPILAFYGGKDKGITSDQIEQLRAKLKADGSPDETIIYPDAEHGFNAELRPSYNEAAATDAMKRALAWLKKYGAA